MRTRKGVRAVTSPIEVLRLAAIVTHEGNLGNGHFANLFNCPIQCCVDARIALRKVETMYSEVRALLTIVDETEGVVGYHLNGAIAAWGEIECIDDLRVSLSASPPPKEGEHVG